MPDKKKKKNIFQPLIFRWWVSFSKGRWKLIIHNYIFNNYYIIIKVIYILSSLVYNPPIRKYQDLSNFHDEHSIKSCTSLSVSPCPRPLWFVGEMPKSHWCYGPWWGKPTEVSMEGENDDQLLMEYVLREIKKCFMDLFQTYNFCSSLIFTETTMSKVYVIFGKNVYFGEITTWKYFTHLSFTVFVGHFRRSFSINITS